jgi:hypothetical protein
VKSKTESSDASPEAQLESFNAKYDPKHQAFVRSIRTALRKRLPTANELGYDYSSFFVIAYSPTEQGIDAPVSMTARADRVELYFNNGPKLADPKKLLQGSGKMTRFVQLRSVRDLSQPDIEGFIAGATELSKIPLPSKGKGSLIIKTNKTSATKKRPSRKAKQ